MGVKLRRGKQQKPIQRRKSKTVAKKKAAVSKKAGTLKKGEVIRSTGGREIAVTQISQYIGPLPRPEDFAKYNHVLPGAADRIMNMAENEQQIRINAIPRVLENETKQIKGAIWISTCMMAVSAYAIHKGFVGTAIFFGVPGILALMGKIFFERAERKKSDE